jgi:hypothetical protein
VAPPTPLLLSPPRWTELVGMRARPGEVLWPRGGTGELPRPRPDTSDMFLGHI